MAMGVSLITRLPTSPIPFLLCGTYYTSNRDAHSPNTKLLFPLARSLARSQAGHLIHIRPRLEMVKRETTRLLHLGTSRAYLEV